MRFSHIEELSIIERARGLTYVFGFIVTFILNILAFYYRDFITIIIVLICVPAFSKIIVYGIPKTFLLDYTQEFNKDQKKVLKSSLDYSAMVCMWFSWMLILANFFIFYNADIILKITPLLFLSIFAYSIYKREIKSRKDAEKLSQSLIKTSWLSKFEKQMKIKETKAKRRITNRVAK